MDAGLSASIADHGPNATQRMSRNASERNARLSAWKIMSGKDVFFAATDVLNRQSNTHHLIGFAHTFTLYLGYKSLNRLFLSYTSILGGPPSMVMM